MRASERPCHAVKDNRFTKRGMKSRRLMGLKLQACLPDKPLSEHTLPPEMDSVNRPEVSRRSDVGLRANRQTRRGLRAAVTGTDPLWRSVLRIARVPYRRALSGAACKTGPKARGRQPRGADANTRKQWRRAADHFLGDLFSAGLSATRGWRSKTSPKPPVVAGFAAAVSCSNQSRH